VPSVEGAAIVWIVLAAIPAATSVVYFFFSRATPPAQRVLVSAHGLYIAALYLGALTIWALQLHQRAYGPIFQALCIAAVGLIVHAVYAFQGNKKIHWLQVLNVLWLIVTFLIGTMGVTGEWL
jgi:hypothetical protein